MRLAIGEGPAEDLVKTGAVILALILLALMVRSISQAGPAPWPAATGPADRPDAARLAVAAAFAVVFAWLVAWPYVLPWYDGLGWAFLALLPLSRLDWLLLARTAALAVGYLPGRTVAMPADLSWLRTVVRTGVTPVILLAVTVALVIMLWPRPDAPPPGRDRPGGAPATAAGDDATAGRGRERLA